MNKIILTTSLLLVAVFTVAYLYFSSISADSHDNDKALSLITNDAALILTFKNDKSIYEIFNDYTVFDAIVGSKKKEELSALKSLLQDSKTVFENTSGEDIFLSFHPLKGDSVAFLWTMALPQGLEKPDLIEGLQRNSDVQIKESKIGETDIIEADVKSLRRIFYLHVSQDVISGSFSKVVMINSLDPKTEKIGPRLIEEVNRSTRQSQNSPASVFINFPSSIPFLAKFFRNKLSGNFTLLNRFNAIATLNMNFKSDALMLNGITETDTTKQNYINLFLHQKAVNNPIKRIVPDNTANYIAYGVSDYHIFHQDLKGLLKARNELEKLKVNLDLIRNETGIDVDRDIKKYWGNEFITFQLSTQEKFGGIQLTNGRQMQFFMDPISSEYADNIRHLDYPGILYYYFGDAFKQFNKPFFAIVDNQMIVSNSARALQRYSNRYRRNLLHTNQGFINFDQLVADNSNISVFVHTRNSGSNIKSQLKPAYASNFKSGEFGLNEFYGFSYQLSSENYHFFTNFYAGYKEKPADKSVSATPNVLNRP